MADMRNPAGAIGGALETVHAMRLNTTRDSAETLSLQRLCGYQVNDNLVIVRTTYEAAHE
jgi:hypothetical protein